MKDRKALASTAMAGLLALGTGFTADMAVAGKPDMEKCAGIAKAGKNDCGTSAHSCAGQATKDGDKEEWVYVPIGTCNRIVGGKLLQAKK